MFQFISKVNANISFVLDEHSLYQIEIHFGHLRFHLFG